MPLIVRGFSLTAAKFSQRHFDYNPEFLIPNSLMPPDYLSAEAMRAVVTAALRKFARSDLALLHLGVQEETLAHRVAVYLEKKLKGWHVDCEYNRNLQAVKMRADGLNRMRPDIIAHIRNSPRNLLFVEIKKTTHTKKKKTEAIERVVEMTGKWTNHPKYCHGVVLTFPVRFTDPRKIVCKWYHRDGACAGLTGGEPHSIVVEVPLPNFPG